MASSGARLVGRVKRLLPADGAPTYGFIRAAAGRDDLFFHMSHVATPDIAEGDRVEFTLHVDARGRANATDVTAAAAERAPPQQQQRGQQQKAVVVAPHAAAQDAQREGGAVRAEAVVEVAATSADAPWGSLRVRQIGRERLPVARLLTYHIDDVDRRSAKPQEDDVVHFVIAEDEQGEYGKDVVVVARASLPRYRGVVDTIKGSRAWIRPAVSGTTTAVDLPAFYIERDFAASVAAGSRTACEEHTPVFFSLQPNTPGRAVYVCGADTGAAADVSDARLAALQLKPNEMHNAVVVRDCALDAMPLLHQNAVPLPGLVRVRLDASTDLYATFEENDIAPADHELVGSMLNVGDEVQCRLDVASPFDIRARRVRHVRFGPHEVVTARVKTIKRRNGFVVIQRMQYHVYFPINGDCGFVEGDDVECTLITSNIQGRPTAFNLKRLPPTPPEETIVLQQAVPARVVRTPQVDDPGLVEVTGRPTIEYENRDVVGTRRLAVNDEVTVDIVTLRNGSTAAVRLTSQRAAVNDDPAREKGVVLMLALPEGYGFIVPSTPADADGMYFSMRDVTFAPEKLRMHSEVTFVRSVSRKDGRPIAVDITLAPEGSVKSVMPLRRGRIEGNDKKPVTSIVCDDSDNQGAVYTFYEADVAADLCGFRAGDRVTFFGMRSGGKQSGSLRAFCVAVEEPADEERSYGIVIEMSELQSVIWTPEVTVRVPLTHWARFDEIAPPPTPGTLVSFVVATKGVRSLRVTRVKPAADDGSVVFKTFGDVKHLPTPERPGRIVTDDASILFTPEALAEPVDVGDAVEFTVVYDREQQHLAARGVQRHRRKSLFSKRAEPSSERARLQLAPSPDVAVLRQPRGPDGTIGFSAALWVR